jgi:hypothetical protein
MRQGDGADWLFWVGITGAVVSLIAFAALGFYAIVISPPQPH